MFDLYSKMFQALTPGNIEEMAKTEKGTAMGGIKAIVLAWLVVLIIAIIGVLLNLGAVSTQLDTDTAISGGTVLGGLLVLSIIAAELIGLVVSIAIGYAMHFAGSWVAKSFFKGTGNFAQQFYIAMLFGGAITMLNALLGFLLQMAPFLGSVRELVGMLFGLYYLYLLYLTLRSVQKVEMVGAVATMIVMAAVAFAIMFVAGFIGMALVASLGLAGADTAVGGV